MSNESGRRGFEAREAGGLAILGSYPPPYGGVATHLLRLAPLLAKDGVCFTIYNAVSSADDPPQVRAARRPRTLWLLWFLAVCRERAIYVLSDRIAVWSAVALFAVLRRKRFAIQLRNSRLLDWRDASPLRARAAAFLLKRADLVVGVSQRLAAAAVDSGVPQARVLAAPAFLPPEPGSEAPDRMHPDVREFVDSHSPLIAANGKVNWYDGADLYGLDMLVRLATTLVPKYPELGIVVCFWDHLERDRAYLDDLTKKARAAGVGSNILFHTKPGPFVPVLARSDVFVRPTNTDGEAASVREALYYGVPAVASDCVDRPPGALLFPTRDQRAFEAIVVRALSTSERTPMPANSLIDIREYTAALKSILSS